MSNESLVIKLHLVEIPVKDLSPDTFPLSQTDFPDITGSDDWIYQALAVKLSVAIVTKKDEGQLSSLWLKNAQRLLSPWRWKNIEWKAALRIGSIPSDNWTTNGNHIKVTTIKTDPNNFLEQSFKKNGDPENNEVGELREELKPELFLDRLDKNTEAYLDKVIESGTLNPSAQFAVYSPDKKIFIRYTDAPTQTVHEALEELGQQPTAIAHNLKLTEYFVVAIKKEQTQPFDRPMVSLIPQFKFDLFKLDNTEIEVEFAPEDTAERVLFPSTTPQKNATWDYKEISEILTFTPYVSIALAGKFIPVAPTPPSPIASALFGLSHGQLINADGNISIAAAGQKNEKEIYTENWVPFIPERLASSYNPLGGLLDYIREQLPHVMKDDSKRKRKALFQFWQSAFPALLRDRAGTGIIGRLDGSVPALTWRNDILAKETIGQSGIEFSLDTILAKLAHHELNTLDNTAEQWIENILTKILKKKDELKLITILLEGLSAAITDDENDPDASLKFSIYLELSEKLARIITDPEFLAELIWQEWEKSKSNVVNLAKISTMSFFQFLSHTKLPETTLKRTGMLDFTKSCFTALSMKSNNNNAPIFPELNLGKVIEFSLLTEVDNAPISLSIFIKFTGNTKATLSWSFDDEPESALPFQNGNLPFEDYKKITRITYFLRRKENSSNYIPLEFSLYVEYENKSFHTENIPLKVKNAKFLSDKMWCELRSNITLPPPPCSVSERRPRF